MKTMRRNRPFSSPFRTAGLLVSAYGLAQTWVSNAQPTMCRQGSDEVGYTTIAAVNSDMQAELAKIQGGGMPQSQYTFNLCSQTEFDATVEPLRPVLSNSFFVCGSDGKSSNLCTFLGGPLQVEILDSVLQVYPLTDITVSGVTFAGFTEAAIDASASLPSILNLMDVVFTGFNAEFVVQQTPRNASETGMSVAVANAAINSGTVGSAFANNGGQLTISNLIAEDVDAASLISTSNEGTSFLEDSIVRNSAVDSITTTTSAASQSVNGVQVQKMRRLSETFTVSGSLSGLAISSTIVSDNNATIGASWSGVTVRSGASATVDSFEMSRNAGLEFGVSVSSTDSRLVVKESLFVENQGTATGGVSSAAITLSKSSLSIERTVFSGNRGFSGELLALVTSSLSLSESCIQDGDAKFVVFADATSNYTTALNYLNSYVSVECSEAEDPALRLFKETSGSGCFIGTNVCEGTCEVLADQAQCAIQNGTTVPTSSPVSVNTTAPTVSPTVQSAPTTRKPTSCRKSKKGKSKKGSKSMKGGSNSGKGKGKGGKSSGSKGKGAGGKGMGGEGLGSKSLKHCIEPKSSKEGSKSSSSWNHHDRRLVTSSFASRRDEPFTPRSASRQRTRIRDEESPRHDLRGTINHMFVADPLRHFL